jgi:hypothetical protein
MLYDKQAGTYPMTQLHPMCNSNNFCMTNKQEIAWCVFY